MQAFVKLASGPHQQIFGNPQPSKCSIRQVAVLSLRRRIVGYDKHDVVVAINAGISPSDGTEKIDAIWAVRLYETAHHFGESRITGCRCPEESGGLLSHVAPSPVCHILSAVGLSHYLKIYNIQRGRYGRSGLRKGMIMTRILIVLLVIAAVALAKKLEMKDLPPAVQKTVQAEMQGAQVKNISKETEHGVTQYEIETLLNGKRRDFNVDTKGTLLVVEEETTIDSIPAAAKAAILKSVAGGKLGMVELFKRGGETMYEASYTSKDGKKHEVLVWADGTATKD